MVKDNLPVSHPKFVRFTYLVPNLEQILYEVFEKASEKNCGTKVQIMHLKLQNENKRHVVQFTQPIGHATYL